MIIAAVIFTLLCGVSGGVLASLDAYITTWQFWVETGCVIGAYACGIVIGRR